MNSSEYNRNQYNKFKNRIYTDDMFNKKRKCVKCKENKLSSEFFKKPAMTDGFDRKCKECRYILTAEYEKSPRCKMTRREYYYYTNYNMTFKDVAKIKEEHNHQCDICHIKESELKRKLHIDHCHYSGKVRGILCDNCNKALGSMKDSIEILENAALYLKNHMRTKRIKPA